MRDRHHLLPDANFDGPALLKEQVQLLSESTPADINFLHFLKLRLSAQQRATAQRNYWHRVQQETDGVSAHAAAPTGAGRSTTAASAIPTVGADAYPAAASWNVQSTPVREEFGGARSYGERNSEHVSAAAILGPRSPMEESSMFSGSVLSRFDGSSSALPLPYQQQQQHQLQQQQSSMWSHPTAFEDLPASVAKRAMTRDSSALGSPSSSALDGRAATLDETPAIASGKPQLPTGVEEVKDVALEPCPHCGRTFAPGRLERHAVTCERQQLTNPKAKAEGKDRKTSSGSLSSYSKAERVPAATASNAKPPAAAVSGGGGAAPPSASKTEKWRRQSAQLRSALAGTSAAEDDRVQCPSCGRRFAEEAANRHIPICKAKEGRHL